MTIIDCFQYPNGEHSPLSNFYWSPWIKDTENSIYETVEHYYQAMKSVDPNDRKMIRDASTPGRAKKLGRQVALRPDWEAIKYDVMAEAIRQKFTLTNDLGPYLLSTDEAFLVEGNTWGDRVWGRVNGVGQNWLGTILMARRAELRSIRG